MLNGYLKLLNDNTMDTTELRENFTNQLANVETQIAKLEDDLVKAKEYRFKLQGGLETLDLLNPPQPTEETTEENT